MRTIKLTMLGSLFLFGLTECSQYPEEIWAENEQRFSLSLSQLKKDSLTIIKEKHEQFFYFKQAFESINEIVPTTTHKNIKLLVDAEFPSENFNTLYIHKNFYNQQYNHDLPLPVYDNLYNIQRLIKGENLVFWGNEKEDKIAIERLKMFKSFCKRFVETEYILIFNTQEIKMPKIVNGDSYEQGSYSGICALYDFQNKQLIDNFMFEATSATDISAVMDSYDKIVLQDLFNQVRNSIYNELTARYSLEGSLPVQAIRDGVTLNGIL